MSYDAAGRGFREETAAYFVSCLSMLASLPGLMLAPAWPNASLSP